jgi:hypothetical protein
MAEMANKSYKLFPGSCLNPGSAPSKGPMCLKQGYLTQHHPYIPRIKPTWSWHMIF